MDRYFCSVVRAIARYGKASLRALSEQEGVSAIIEIDFKAPVSALSVREYLNEFYVSLLVPTGPWRFRPIGFTIIGRPEQTRTSAGSTRWSILLEPSPSEKNIDRELVRALAKHSETSMNEECGKCSWTDFVIALCFHGKDTRPGLFTDSKYVLRILNEEYSCGRVVPELDDGSEDLIRHHKTLGEEVACDLFDAIDADDEYAYNSDLSNLLMRADKAFAPMT